MNRLALLLAPIALFLPSISAAVQYDARASQIPKIGISKPSDRISQNAQAADDDPRSELGFAPSPDAPFQILDNARKQSPRAQVRIEQRVIIRISPSSAETRRRVLARLPKRQIRTRFQEVKHDECVEADGITGVQATADNRLLLFMRDRVLTATLDRGCTARAFYAGFYVERSKDGKICVSREDLQSRAGASCKISELNRLVAVRN